MIKCIASVKWKISLSVFVGQVEDGEIFKWRAGTNSIKYYTLNKLLQEKILCAKFSQPFCLAWQNLETKSWSYKQLTPIVFSVDLVFKEELNLMLVDASQGAVGLS